MWLLAAILVPALLIPAAYVAGGRKPKAGALVCVLASLISLALVTVAYLKASPVYLEEYRGWIPSLERAGQPLTLKLFVDGASYLAALATLVLLIAASLYSADYIEHSHGTYYALLLLLLTGLLGIFLTANLLAFYIFIEFMLVPAYFIISEWGLPGARRAAFKFFIYAHVGALFVLIGIALTYHLFGTLDIFALPKAARAGAPWGLLFALFTFGFLVKAGVFPVHSWLPDAHSIAPTPMSSLLSGIIAATGVYSIFRISLCTLLLAAKTAGVQITYPLMVLGAIGLVSVYYGGYLALRERDIKRIPAYSTISHNGYMVTGLALGFAALSSHGLSLLFALALVGALYHLLAHALCKGLFFMVAGTVLEETHERDITRTGMLLKLMPWTGAFGLIAAFGIAGAPPLATFISEFMMIVGSIYSGLPHHLVYTALLAIGTALSAAYALRFWWFVFWKGPAEARYPDVRRAARIGMLLLAILAILCGVLPAPLVKAVYAGLQLYVP